MKISMLGPLILCHILMYLHAKHDTNFCHVNTEDDQYCDSTEPIHKKERVEVQRVRERYIKQTTKIPNKKIGKETRDSFTSKEASHNQNGDCFLTHAHSIDQQIQTNQVRIRGSKRKKKKLERRKKWKRKKNKRKFVHKSCQIIQT